MDAVLDDVRLQDAVVASQDASLARLRAKDFGATLLRNVDTLLAAGSRAAPKVAWDFWAQFDQVERLEELRQFRPALFRALPEEPALGVRGPALEEPELGARRAAPEASDVLGSDDAGDVTTSIEPTTSESAERRTPNTGPRQ
jgi:hypothetical protein